MDAEQVCPAKVLPDVFGGEGEVLILLTRLEYGCSQEAGGSKTSTGLGDCSETFEISIEHIGSACTLNMDINEAGGNYPALSVEYVVAGNFGFDSADVRDDAIFDENAGGWSLLASIEQPAIHYQKFL
jgi:hypothetical protein